MKRKPISTFVPRKHQKELFGVDDEKLIEIMKKSYNVSEQTISDSVAKFKEWYSKQPHLPDVEFDDGFIMRQLNVNKFSLEICKQKIDNLFTAMSTAREYFGNRDTHNPKIYATIQYGQVGVIPKLTEDDYRINIYRFTPNRDTNFEFESLFMGSLLFSDMKQEHDASQGDIFIFDLKEFNMDILRKMTPSTLKKYIFIVGRCYGSRVKMVHMVNLSGSAELLVGIYKSCVSKKISSRIMIHTNHQSLQDHIPKELLPSDYGGDFPMSMDQLSNKTLSTCRSPEWRDWYIRSSQIKTDESKRPAKNADFNALMEMNGTFRKLDID